MPGSEAADDKATWRAAIIAALEAHLRIQGLIDSMNQ
jgi:hypothetical protein